jgi:hypothetical protein
MNIETIYLENKVILVDKDAWLKEGDFFYSEFKGEKRTLLYNHQIIPFPNDYKILAANPPIADLPLLPLPDEEEAIKLFGNPQDILTNDEGVREGVTIGFMLGYKAAKEGAFTKEDMISFGKYVQDVASSQTFHNKTLTAVKLLLEIHLSRKPKPQFIPEMEEYDNENPSNIQPKIVDGKIVGKWEYTTFEPIP